MTDLPQAGSHRGWPLWGFVVFMLVLMGLFVALGVWQVERLGEKVELDRATIWRVPPGGGAPTPWFTSPIIDGPFGPNGIRVDAKSQMIYFIQSLNGTGAGFVYTLPIKDNPVPADLQLFHTFEAGAIPDGIAFGKSGKLYVALAGASKIAVLSAEGAEIARYSGPAQGTNSATPWANPANIAFNNGEGTLLVTNHASLTGLPDPSALFIIFDVFVDDKAGKMFGDFEN